MINQERTETCYLDVLRIFAILCVIFLHCISDYIVQAELFNTKTWWLCNIANCISRTGVPLFFMISGYLLLNSPKKLSFTEFYSKRLARILIPFLVWDVIYFLYNSLVSGGKIEPLNFFRELLVNGSSYHFWFVYTIAGIYLFLPFLKMITDSCSLKQLLLLLAIITFAPTLRPFFNTVTPIYIFLFNPLAEGYIGFFLLGYILGKFGFKKSIRLLIYLGGLAGGVICIWGNYLFSSYEKVNLYFNGGYQLNHFLCAAAIFVFAKNSKIIRNLKGKAKIMLVSGLTYTIYLVHVLILSILERNFIIARPVYAIFCYFFITVSAGTLTALILSKIRYVNKIFT